MTEETMQIKKGMKTATTSVLSKREMEVMQLIRQGLLNKEVAQRMFVSSETIKTHLKSIYQKLGASNRIDALNKIDTL